MKQEIKIKVSGRIPKYFFGTVKEEFQSELDEIVQYCNEDIEDEQDFLMKILGLTLEDSESEREVFFNEVISEDDLNRFPNFKKLHGDIIEEDAQHFRLFEMLFDSDWTFGSISFFETDARVEITSGDETLFEGTLEEFADEASGGNMEEHSEFEDAEEIRQLAAANPSYGMDVEYGNWFRNEKGALFAAVNVDAPGLVDMSKSDYSVTIHMDDIVDHHFIVEAEEFDMSKLAFVSHVWADQFRNSACTTKFNYVFYDREEAWHEETWHRDKGISLLYNSDDSLDFLLNG